MRRVIGGKVYNSRTATEIAKADRRRLGEAYWYQERLFETKAGTHFIIGIGGPLTRWNDDVGLIALDKRQTSHWLVKHGFDEPAWGRDDAAPSPEPDCSQDGKVFVGFYSDSDTKHHLTRTAYLEGMSMSELLNLVVRAYNATGKLPGALHGC